MDQPRSINPFSTKWCSYVVTTARPGAAAELLARFRDVAVAHRSVGNGNRFTTYTCATEPDRLHIYLPFVQFAELDRWRTNRDCIAEHYGEAAASAHVEAFNAAVDTIDNSIMRFADEISHAAALREALPAHVLQVTARIIAAKASPMAVAMEAMIEAHRDDPRGVAFGVHAPFVGDSLNLRLYVPLPSPEGRDFLALNREVVRDRLGPERAAQVIADFEGAMVSHTARVLSYQAELSGAA